MTDKPKLTRRRLLYVAVFAVALLTMVSCISFQSAMAGTVTDATGKAVADAYVFYTYDGKNYGGLVHATSYRRGGGILRTAQVLHHARGLRQSPTPSLCAPFAQGAITRTLAVDTALP